MVAIRNADRSISAERLIAAPPEVIFAIVADPDRHPEIDGSGMVTGGRPGNQRITKVGDQFGMSMKQSFAPYKTKCVVLEYEENRRIAWTPKYAVAGVVVLGGQIWRYELEPRPNEIGRTMVRETYDWGPARFSKGLELLGYPKRFGPALTATLERLAQVAEAEAKGARG